MSFWTSPAAVSVSWIDFCVVCEVVSSAVWAMVSPVDVMATSYLRSPSSLGEVGGFGAGGPYELLRRQQEHGVRRSRGRPDLLEGKQSRVQVRVQRSGVPERGRAAD